MALVFILDSYETNADTVLKELFVGERWFRLSPEGRATISWVLLPGISLRSSFMLTFRHPDMITSPYSWSIEFPWNLR